MSELFNIYSWGLVAASVCTNLSDEEATRRLNLELPTGISSQWEINPEPFHTGEPNPTPCNIAGFDQQREGCRHVLFHC